VQQVISKTSICGQTTAQIPTTKLTAANRKQQHTKTGTKI